MHRSNRSRTRPRPTVVIPPPTASRCGGTGAKCRNSNSWVRFALNKNPCEFRATRAWPTPANTPSRGYNLMDRHLPW